LTTVGGSAHGLPFWGTLGATFYYDDWLWFGGGYGYQTKSHFIAGVRLAEQLVSSYSYGFSTENGKDYGQYLGASHEICLGYRIQRANSKTKDTRLSQELTQLQYIVDNQSQEIDRLKQERLELKEEMARNQLDRETIDSLIKSVNIAFENTANLLSKQQQKDSIFDSIIHESEPKT
jgi:uncharacterized protein YdcH (DUF465 family)